MCVKTLAVEDVIEKAREDPTPNQMPADTTGSQGGMLVGTSQGSPHYICARTLPVETIMK
jgi:hypothetical protein